ncbi:MAG: hypothetical protein IJU50_07340, partial [Lachnospiraceae bacterium]|nr:hypothetical protein [Lachnospiraceae bacterium]
FSEESKLAAKDKIALGADEASQTVSVKITGKGNYQSQPVYATYRVIRTATAPINLSKAKIVAKEKNAKGKDIAIGKQGYTGGEIKPEIRVLVKVKKDKKTVWQEVPAGFYDVKYINNVGKGKATVLVTGNGTDAAGSKAAKFSITTMSMGAFR